MTTRTTVMPTRSPSDVYAGRPRRSRGSRRRSLIGAAALLGVVGLVSGCGVAGTDFRPGVAADVNGTRITVAEVDELTRSACDAFGDQLADGNQVVPLSVLRTALTQSLVLASAVRQLGDDNGLAPGAIYRAEVDQVRDAAGDLSAAELRAVEVLQASNALITDVLGQVGARLAAAEDGADPAATDPTGDAALQRGSAAFSAWLDEHDTVIDPQFGIELTPQGVATADTSVSFAVSDVAAGADAESPDPQATMDLPPTQRCGNYTSGSS